jgi:hypothetical protein
VSVTPDGADGAAQEITTSESAPAAETPVGPSGAVSTLRLPGCPRPTALIPTTWYVYDVSGVRPVSV